MAVGKAADEVVGGIGSGKADAIRHAFWNAYMSLQAPGNFAEDFSTAHEADRPEDGNDDHIMDLNNNKIGRDVFKGILGKRTFQQLYLGVIESANNGKLMMINPTTKKAEFFKLKPEEYEQLKEIKVSDLKDNEGNYEVK